MENTGSIDVVIPGEVWDFNILKTKKEKQMEQDRRAREEARRAKEESFEEEAWIGD